MRNFLRLPLLLSVILVPVRLPAQSAPQYSRTFELKGWAAAVDWSPDGRTLAAASSEGEVRLWDKNGAPRHSFTLAGEGGAQTLAFSPDGKYLAAGGDSGGVFIFRLADMTLSARLRLHKSSVKAVAWSPDSRYFASASTSGTAVIWDAAALRPVKTLRAHDGCASGAAFSPDGKLLATSGCDESVKIWSVPSGEPVKTLRGINANANAVAFSPDGRFAAVVSADRIMQLWRVSGWKLANKLEQAHRGELNAAAFSPDSRLLATAGDDGLLKLWTVPDFNRVRTIKNYSLNALSLRFGPGDGFITAGYMLGVVRVWDWTREDARVSAPKASLEDKNGGELAKLPHGAQVTVLWDKNPGAKLSVEYEGREGRVKRSALAFSDRLPPALRITAKSLDGHTLEISGAAYDDCAVSSVTLNGRPVRWSEAKTPKGNYSDVFAFKARVLLKPGAPPVLRAEDLAGRRQEQTIGAVGKPQEWMPKLVEIKTAGPARIKENFHPASAVLRTAPSGAPLTAVGYNKGYYRLSDGGWILSDSVTGR
ncbi:MAG: WD40 repeat domain-containing protein [Elusimicrobiales bacterium]|nr:WD40 repeat domain-containing protein [Elusimicrobiales bacterium]